MAQAVAAGRFLHAGARHCVNAVGEQPAQAVAWPMAQAVAAVCVLHGRGAAYVQVVTCTHAF